LPVSFIGFVVNLIGVFCFHDVGDHHHHGSEEEEESKDQDVSPNSSAILD